jgi:hypothetical protein
MKPEFARWVSKEQSRPRGFGGHYLHKDLPLDKTPQHAAESLTLTKEVDA